MINRHSHDQSVEGEGVHVVKNEQCEDEEHGKGQYTEKRVYLSRCCKVSVPEEGEAYILRRGGRDLHLEKEWGDREGYNQRRSISKEGEGVEGGGIHPEGTGTGGMAYILRRSGGARLTS